MFDRVVNQIATTTTAGGAGSTSAQAAAALVRFGVINSDRIADKSNEEPIREEDGALSVSVAERMLKWHAEAIGRCVELSPPNDVSVIRCMNNVVDSYCSSFRPKSTFTLLRILAEAISTSYVEVAIETLVLSRNNLLLTLTIVSFPQNPVFCHDWTQLIRSRSLVYKL